MPLKELSLNNTAVTNIDPLKHLPLMLLDLGNTDIVDLSALRSLPLVKLGLADCSHLSDLSPLEEIKTLEELSLPPGAKDIGFLRELPNLKRLSFSEDEKKRGRPDKTAEEFWAEYDAGLANPQ